MIQSTQYEESSFEYANCLQLSMADRTNEEKTIYAAVVRIVDVGDKQT